MTQLCTLGYVNLLCPRTVSWDGGKDREVLREADISATQAPAPADSWISQPDENTSGTPGTEAAAGKRSSSTSGLALRYRDGQLRSRYDFNNLYDHGTTIRGSLAVLVFLPNGREETRRGFVASKKCGGAVARNRSKRLLREAYRIIRSSLELSGLDLVLIARPRCKDAKIVNVVQDFEQIFRTAGLWISPAETDGDPC